MAGRPDMTLLIRTPGLLMRADVRDGGEPKVTRWRRDWPDGAAAVAHALAEGGKPGRRVWVLDSEVWLGVVDLPSGAVAGQSDKDLAGPAAYEAEAVSDLSPTEAVTAVQRRRMADKGDQFLVTQARRSDVAAVAKAVRHAGAKLAGLGHPAGLPAPLWFEEHHGEDGDWRRVEFWYESVVLVESVAGRVGLMPLGVGPRSNWRRSLEPRLRAGAPIAEDQTLVGPGVRPRDGTRWRESISVENTARWLAAGEDSNDEDDGVPLWDLAEDDAAERLAQSWAAKLASAPQTESTIAPTLRPPKAPASRWPAVLVGVVVLALAVFTVVSLRDQASHRLTDLQDQLAQVQEDRRKVEDRRDQAKQAKADLRGKQKTIDRLEGRLERLRRQSTSSRANGAGIDRRAALGAMMASLTSSSSDATVIQSIEHGSPRHEIKGMATSPEAATRLARDLSEKLYNHWTVSPAQIEPEAGPEQVAWRFTITIEPAIGEKGWR